MGKDGGDKKRKVEEEDLNPKKRRRWNEEDMDDSLKQLVRVCPVCGSGKPHIQFKMFANQKSTQPRYKCHVCPREFTLGGKSHCKRRKSTQPSDEVVASEDNFSCLDDNFPVEVADYCTSDDQTNNGDSEPKKFLTVSKDISRHSDDFIVEEEDYSTSTDERSNGEDSESSCTDSESSTSGSSDTDGESSTSGSIHTDGESRHSASSLQTAKSEILNRIYRW